MKFSSLHIDHFGHFTQFDLPLDDAPFVLLHGHNEAGKTTLLQFLRQLLFGFPERTPYNFGDGGELAGAATLTLQDGRKVDLWRRKGRKNTLRAKVDSRDAELDDAAFRQLLGNANENVFKTVFAFGLDELRAGNEGLKDESLQSALFGGGLGGGRNTEALLASLDDDASRLFKPAASRPTINRLSAEIKQLAAEVKQQLLRPDDYERRRAACEEARLEAERLGQELPEMRRRLLGLERLRDALPSWRELQVIEARHRELKIATPLPRDAESRFFSTREAIERWSSQIVKLEAEQSDTKQRLAESQLDQTLLPLRTEIESSYQLLPSVAEWQRELPLLIADTDRKREQLLATLRELRPDWTLQQLGEFAVDIATRDEFEKLCERRRELDRQHDTLTALRAANETKRQAAAEVDSLDPATESEPPLALLEAVLAGSDEFLADLKAETEDEVELSRLDGELTARRARLSPPLSTNTTTNATNNAAADAATIVQLPVPSRERIEQQVDAARRLARRLEAAEQAIAEATQSRDELVRELESLSQQFGAVPTLDDLRSQRDARDELWRTLWSSLTEGKAATKRKPISPENFELALRAADQTADLIYQHAHEVTRREDLRRRVVAAEANVAKRVAEQQQIAASQAEFESSWRTDWNDCGVEPFSPEVMLAWHDQFAALTTMHASLRQQQAKLAARRGRREQFETRLRELLPDVTRLDGAALLSAAKQFVAAARERRLQRQQRERETQRLQDEMRAHDQRAAELQAADEAWQAPWRTLLTGLKFPETWDVDLSRSVLDQLAAARQTLAALRTAQTQIESLETRSREFVARVGELAEQLGMDCGDEPAERVVETLHERLTEASRIQERGRQLEQSLEKLQRELRGAQAALHTERARRDESLAIAQVDTDDDYLALCQRCQTAETLDAARRELTGKLAMLRANDTEVEFAEKLAAADETQLSEQIESLRREIDERQRLERQTRERAGAARRDFEQLDGSDTAATLRQEMARKQAELVELTHRFVPLVFARQLLHSAIQRFDRDNQPELIRRASELLATMTSGRYVEIERPSSDPSALYIRRDNGAELSPDQLSTGTREQLYLAIRLGYVLHYCRQNEPLPIVMDDVLVNFDAPRARATLAALRDVSDHAQVLFFTCHDHVADWVRDEIPSALVRDLHARESKPAAV